MPENDWCLRCHVEGGIIEDVDDLMNVLAVHFKLLLEEQIVGKDQVREDVGWREVDLDQLILDGGYDQLKGSSLLVEVFEMLFVEVPQELDLRQFLEKVSNCRVFIVKMASSQTKCDIVENKIHFASPAPIVKIILEGSDQ